MKRPKLAGVFLFVGCLLIYLMFVKRHYKPGAHEVPLHPQPAPDQHDASEVRRFQYGIMFDAGSTGTRIHVFKFQINDKEAPKLDHETFQAIKPGLSAYADNPEKCTAGIVELLEVAKASVPPSMWNVTLVVLKATAGLRLLPGEKAHHLLDRVRALFAASPFLSREDSVSIMDGTDEGISAWITINVLTGGFLSDDSPTVGMLDLGGGSTQITFSPRDEKTIQMSPIDHIRSFQMFSRTHTVYTHSYLGLGLMSARLALLGGIDALPLGESTHLVSPCLAPDYLGRWEHGDIIYTVKGQKAGEQIYDACLTKVEKLLYKKVAKVAEAAEMEFYAFSYYYDRAVDLGVINEQEGGVISVAEYIDAAKRVCSTPSVSLLKYPFLCLDLVYISVLLQEFGFPPHKHFKLARTINHVKTSWALGAAFHYIHSLKRQ